ncbi:hypothetical protein GCM10010331_49600 [Streptomyces xanthochromogenes]|uniref:hypothetical protein n=1 Tax=Streptomyces xanthochromogenes TaxID=67384 RepID=UPI001674FF8E|nr:hypothetical protein [Streptomyces xanthochromogenes]GHB55819.1 hypothetical protein GCM10010331_49600 [Streptomyces xanthochromogenes]
MTALDPDEQAFLDLHAPAEEAHVDCPGYHSGLGAHGAPWPATTTDLNLPEETT